MVYGLSAEDKSELRIVFGHFSAILIQDVHL